MYLLKLTSNYSLFQNVAKIFHNVAKIFHNVAKIFHNVENVFTTSITAQSSSSDVVNGIVALTATGQHSLPHTRIATRNTRASETNHNKMTMAVQGRYPGGPRRRVAAAHVVTGMSDSGSLIEWPSHNNQRTSHDQPNVWFTLLSIKQNKRLYRRIDGSRPSR